MGALVKQFSGIEKQALRKLNVLHNARDLGDLRRIGSKPRRATGAGSTRFELTISGVFASLGPGRVRPMSKSSTTTRGVATPIA
jgi:hypothetical protein